MAATIKVDTIENIAGSGNVSLGSGHNLVVPGNITGQGTAAITSNATVGGTLGVTGATTTTGGVTIPASTTVGLNFGSGTDLAQLAMQSGVSNRVALRTTHTSTGDNNPFVVYQPSSAGVQNDALVINTGGQITKSKQPAHMQTALTASSDAYMTAGQQRLNKGGMTYNSSNGRITVPVAGVYALHASAFTNGANAKLMLQFHVNGSQLSNSEGFAASTTNMIHDSANIFYVTQLSANDYIQVIVHALTTSVYNGGGGNHFGVFLLG